MTKSGTGWNYEYKLAGVEAEPMIWYTELFSPFTGIQKSPYVDKHGRRGRCLTVGGGVCNHKVKKPQG